MNDAIIAADRLGGRQLADPYQRFSADRADDAIAGSLAGRHPVGCALHLFHVYPLLCAASRPTIAVAPRVVAVGRAIRTVIVARAGAGAVVAEADA
jgi:hypothetical protein